MESVDSFEARLQTFQEQGWDFPVAAEELARNGFSFTGTGDKVKCCQCDLELYDWNASDDPTEEHSKFGKKGCCFVNSSGRVKGCTVADVYKDNEPNYDPPEGEIPKCMACEDQLSSVRLEPCYHFVVCEACVKKLKTCPKCNKGIEKWLVCKAKSSKSE